MVFRVFKSISKHKFYIALIVASFGNKMCKFYHILPARCVIVEKAVFAWRGMWSLTHVPAHA